MSPAPQGGLEVERYIGSCLISRSSSGKQFGQKLKKPTGDISVRQFVLNPRDSADHAGGPRYAMPPPPMPGDFYPRHGWAGMPLFCMASNGQRRHRKGPAGGDRCPKPHNGGPHKTLKCSIDARDGDGDGRSPLSRLAIHTQGAPLIQAGRYSKLGFNRGGGGGGGGPPLRAYRGGDAAVRRTDSSRDVKAAQNKEPGSCDSVSVASDESSANSENSLPRIIKPRKRRKKDRKLPPPSVKTGEPATLPAVEENKPSVSSVSSAETLTPAVGSSKTEEPIGRQTVETILSDGGDASLSLRSGDDLPSEPEQDDGSASASTCQCRYCDPAGVIWDVDQRCYSPYLTPPSPTESRLSYGFRGYDPGPALRRSWSEPSSSTIPQVQPRTRAVSESQTRTQPQQQSLEVSSEIITSPNGHRDIEIKFFSPKTNVARQYKVEE